MFSDQFVAVNLCCSVSSGNLSAFDVFGSKAREIVGDYIITTGNKESCPRQHRNFKSKSLLPKLRRTVAPYSNDNRNNSREDLCDLYFHGKILVLITSPWIHSAIASWIHSYFDKVSCMTKFIISNRTDTNGCRFVKCLGYYARCDWSI